MSSFLECQLCPKYCRIPEGGTGDCGIRMHLDGRLLATTYGLPCSVHMDPIEKKPLFHFLPGSAIFSVATVGCNLHCRNCQNHTISQAYPDEFEAFEASPERLLEAAQEASARAIAYTYTEPLVYYEYTLDCARLARKSGLRNVLVSAGFINREPLRELLPHIDAANIDLKAFDDTFYKEYCDGALRPVLQALETFVEMDVWLEVTNLLIPTLNDDPRLIGKMCKWLVKTLGAEVPIHFSRFYPRHQMKHLPPTPAETLETARQIALAEGLRHVYVGNLRSRTGENTYCPNPDCPTKDTPLVQRAGYRIQSNRLEGNRCPACGTVVAGVWQEEKP